MSEFGNGADEPELYKVAAAYEPLRRNTKFNPLALFTHGVLEGVLHDAL